uniref:Uncharacterized protein n=1 Tax=Anopheles albimanus TaxID=7167 RepID=A0A182FYJ6_ANOAL
MIRSCMLKTKEHQVKHTQTARRVYLGLYFALFSEY